jgi:hypothetical protein
MRNKFDKGLDAVSIRAAAMKYARHENGFYSTAVNTYWNVLKKKAESLHFQGTVLTEEVYLQCLDEIELKKLGNTDFYYESFFSTGELDLLVVNCAFVAKIGFPLGQVEVQSMAHGMARRVLNDKVKAGEIESFVDLPNTLRDPSGNVGDLPLCGEHWYRG